MHLLPKVFFYARRGPLTPQLVGDNSLTALYHTDAFDYRKPFANHATVFANGIKETSPDNRKPPSALGLRHGAMLSAILTFGVLLSSLVVFILYRLAEE